MPSLVTVRGVRRYRGAVMVKGIRKEKLFPDSSKDSQREAAKWEAVWKKKLKAHVKANDTSVSIDRWANDYLDEIAVKLEKDLCSKKTFQEKRLAFIRLAKEPKIRGVAPVESIDEFVAKRFLKRQFKQNSGSVANRIRKNLAHAWKWGRGEYRLWPKSVINPFRAVDQFPEQRFPRYVPPQQDFWAVYEAIDDSTVLGLQDKTMLLAYIMTAARKSEILRLKRNDVDFENSRIRLWTKKRRGGTWEFDWLPMTSELRSALLKWMKVRLTHKGTDVNHVFVRLDDLPCNAESYGKPFLQRRHFMNRICKNAGIKPFGHHAIRHLTATILYHEGYDPGYIQEVLRHKSLTTTLRYLKSLGLERVRTVLEDGIKVPGKVIVFDEKRKALSAS